MSGQTWILRILRPQAPTHEGKLQLAMGQEPQGPWASFAPDRHVPGCCPACGVPSCHSRWVSEKGAFWAAPPAVMATRPPGGQQLKPCHNTIQAASGDTGTRPGIPEPSVDPGETTSARHAC